MQLRARKFKLNTGGGNKYASFVAKNYGELFAELRKRNIEIDNFGNTKCGNYKVTWKNKAVEFIGRLPKP